MIWKGFAGGGAWVLLRIVWYVKIPPPVESKTLIQLVMDFLGGSWSSLWRLRSNLRV